MTAKNTPTAPENASSGHGCAQAFAQTCEDFIAILRSRSTPASDNAPSSSEESGLPSDLQDLHPLLGPHACRVLQALCEKQTDGIATVTRSEIAHMLGITETGVIKLMREIRLCVARKGCVLKTLRGQGTYELRRIA